MKSNENVERETFEFQEIEAAIVRTPEIVREPKHEALRVSPRAITHSRVASHFSENTRRTPAHSRVASHFSDNMLPKVQNLESHLVSIGRVSRRISDISGDEKVLFKASNVESHLPGGRGCNEYQLTTMNDVSKSMISPSFLDQML